MIDPDQHSLTRWEHRQRDALVGSVFRARRTALLAERIYSDRPDSELIPLDDLDALDLVVARLL